MQEPYSMTILKALLSIQDTRFHPAVCQLPRAPDVYLSIVRARCGIDVQLFAMCEQNNHCFI